MTKPRFAIVLLSLLLLTGWVCAAQVSVLTQHNDTLRTGANLAETTLATSNVNVTTFGKLFSLSVDGSIYAQPLYVPALKTKTRGTHNAVFVATMNDSVYAFDADSNVASNASPIWSVNFTNPAAGITAVPGMDIQTMPNVSGPVGIMGTPVIDPGSGTIYLVARTKESGAYFQRLHALDITSGAERPGSPVVIQASVPGTGYDSYNGVVSFNPMTANQRCGLALSNGQIVIAWGGLDDDFDPYHGWVMTFDATTLKSLGVFIASPNGQRAGLWESGSAPAIDASGNVYYTTGNGSWDGVTAFGDTMLKLNISTGVSLADWFTPDNQLDMDAHDWDLGVSGPLIIPGTNVLLGGSKTGILYLLNTNNLGHLVNGNGQTVQVLQASTGAVHSTPVYYNSPALGPLIYIWSEKDNLKAFHFNGSTLDSGPITQGNFVSAEPGGILSVSANGNQPGTGIVWAAMPVSDDAEQTVVPGILRAFDASNLSKELWNSNLNASRDAVGNFGKFVSPTVVNGKVYLATFSNALNVYGLIGNKSHH